MSSPRPGSPFKIKPVLILSTGRCGSTMISDMLSRHPKILSMSEFFVPLGEEAYAWKRPDGNRMWQTFSEQNAALHAMLKDGLVVDECLYPLDAPGARYRADNLPPILAVTLPHLTAEHEALFDELGPVVKAQPALPLAEHYLALFDYLGKKFNREVWIERSGGSIMHAAKLLKLFPNARVIHVYRDGRDTAMSMRRHHNFNVLVGGILKCRKFGFDPCDRFFDTEGSPAGLWAQKTAFKLLDVKKLAEAGSSLAALGEFWSRLILTADKVFGGFPPERLLNVKFEEVQQSPREKLRELIRFIDPSLEDEAWLNEVAAIPRPARSKFSNLPPDEQAALGKACAPGLELLGYPL